MSRVMTAIMRARVLPCGVSTGVLASVHELAVDMLVPLPPLDTSSYIKASLSLDVELLDGKNHDMLIFLRHEDGGRPFENSTTKTWGALLTGVVLTSAGL